MGPDELTSPAANFIGRPEGKPTTVNDEPARDHAVGRGDRSWHVSRDGAIELDDGVVERRVDVPGDDAATRVDVFRTDRREGRRGRLVVVEDEANLLHVAVASDESASYGGVTQCPAVSTRSSSMSVPEQYAALGGSTNSWSGQTPSNSPSVVGSSEYVAPDFETEPTGTRATIDCVPRSRHVASASS